MGDQQRLQLFQGVWKGIIFSIGLTLSSYAMEPLWAAELPVLEDGVVSLSLEPPEVKTLEVKALETGPFGRPTQAEASLVLPHPLPPATESTTEPTTEPETEPTTEDIALSALEVATVERLADPLRRDLVQPVGLPAARRSLSVSEISVSETSVSETSGSETSGSESDAVLSPIALEADEDEEEELSDDETDADEELDADELELDDLDPELGTLRLRLPEISSSADDLDPELGTLRLRLPEISSSANDLDPELGTLRLRLPEVPPPLLPEPPSPPQAARRPVVYLQGRLSYLHTDNIFSSINPVPDGLTQAGVGLWATPALGPSTYLTAALNADVVRYGDQSQFNYNEIRLNLGLYQVITPRTYGEIGWTNQQLFSAADGDRFLNDRLVRLTLGRRDQLTPQLRLNTSYQTRLSFANPDNRSRVAHYLNASLGYEIQTGLQAGLGYQLAFIGFTQIDRSDSYQQLTANLSYQLSPRSQAFLYGGWRWGGSSSPNLNFDSTLIGGGISINLPLF